MEDDKNIEENQRVSKSIERYRTSKVQSIERYLINRSITGTRQSPDKFPTSFRQGSDKVLPKFLRSSTKLELQTSAELHRYPLEIPRPIAPQKKISGEFFQPFACRFQTISLTACVNYAIYIRESLPCQMIDLA